MNDTETPKIVATKPSVRVVVARFTETLDWLHCLPEDYSVLVSNSGEPLTDLPDSVQVETRENKGREAGHWLQHIVDHYDDLADITVFVQGSPFIGHTPNILFELEREHLTDTFGYLCSNAPRRLSFGETPARAWIRTLVGRKYDVVKLCDGGHHPGAQHYVTKEQVRTCPKEWYDLILKGALRDEHCAHTLEHSYNILYGVGPRADQPANE